MIDWIERLPDWMVGAVAASSLWFGFNYVVLAERAMEKEHAAQVVPNCIATLEGHEQKQKSLVSSLDGLGGALGVPELDRLQRRLIERAMPRFLSVHEKHERCVCAAREAGKSIHFDYAVHTASFRIIAPRSVADMRNRTAKLLSSGMCGSIPHVREAS
jgi:hypothetical protein